MNLYGLDYSLLDLGFTDPTLEDSVSSFSPMIMDRRRIEREEEDLLKISNSILKNTKRNDSPPKHRHDGTSPLPLGMDWSPPPRNWDGGNTIWPHDFHTGWSYCVTVPSWSILSESGGSEPVVFYRVRVGLQTPEGVTTWREVLKRFSDFLKLSSDLKNSFRKKKFPPLPPKGLLRMKSKALLEERRRSLEDWMEKTLSDIDISRSAPIACFLELEAAARSSFSESAHHVGNEDLRGNNDNSSDILSCHSDGPVTAETSKEVMDRNEEKYLHNLLPEKMNMDPNCTSSATPSESSNLGEAHRERSTSSQYSESVDAGETLDALSNSDFQFSPDTLVLLPTNEGQKMKRILTTMQQRLGTSKTDMEDLIARLDQELAIRQYLTTKVKDLETELESTKNKGRENLEQAVLNEKERFTQMQWDMEELRRKCMEMELRLKAEKDGKAHFEAIQTSLIQEKEELQQELDSVREQLKSLKRCHEEADLKSKSDVKLLVREVKSLRSSHSELKQELDRVAKERTESVMRLQKERQKMENVKAANRKLLHECEILRGRLEECSVNFLIEEENRLKVDASSPSDALDILDTSENRIGLLLAEAQLLAHDVEIPVASPSHGNDEVITMDDELRKMLTEVLIDNVILRKQVNSVIRSSLCMTDTLWDGSESVLDSAPSRKTVLSKFLER